MKHNTTRLMIITGVICFLVGGFIGYYARGKAKMTPQEFEYQLSRLDTQETGELVGVLERAWGISATTPKRVPVETSGTNRP